MVGGEATTFDFPLESLTRIYTGRQIVESIDINVSLNDTNSVVIVNKLSTC